MWGKWNKGFCSWWWDSFWGVDISMSCWAHDASYDDCSPWTKLLADYALGRDVWACADLLGGWRRLALKAVAVSMGLGTATFGWLWWIKAILKKEKI